MSLRKADTDSITESIAPSEVARQMAWDFPDEGEDEVEGGDLVRSDDEQSIESSRGSSSSKKAAAQETRPQAAAQETRPQAAAQKARPKAAGKVRARAAAPKDASSKPKRKHKFQLTTNAVEKKQIMKSLHKNLEFMYSLKQWRDTVVGCCNRKRPGYDPVVWSSAFMQTDTYIRLFLTKVASRLRDFIAAKPDFRIVKTQKTVDLNGKKHVVHTKVKKMNKTLTRITVHDMETAIKAVLMDRPHAISKDGDHEQFVKVLLESARKSVSEKKKPKTSGRPPRPPQQQQVRPSSRSRESSVHTGTQASTVEEILPRPPKTKQPRQRQTSSQKRGLSGSLTSPPRGGLRSTSKILGNGLQVPRRTRQSSRE
jgi:hypothetical protein